jgi:hypothetical protein
MTSSGGRPALTLRHVRRHLSYANVTATLALFVALGGTGYAALTLPRNSVGKGQIRAGAVSTAKLANGSVSRSKLHGRSVGAAQVGVNALSGRNIAEKTLGTVPTATLAQSALRAKLADSAFNTGLLAGKTLGQLQDSCPGGTEVVVGGCLANDRSPFSQLEFLNAVRRCTGSEQLPSVAQLVVFSTEHPTTGIELSGDLADSTHVLTVDMANGAIGVSDLNTAHTFRCALAPTNNPR